MVAIAVALLAMSLSVLVVRLGALALEATGVPRHLARFQARSAFLGVGFPPSGTEPVAHLPARRRALSSLMLYGRAAFATLIASLVVAFLGIGPEAAAQRLGVLLVGVIVLVVVVQWRRTSHRLDLGVARLMPISGSCASRDEELLQVSGGYTVRKLEVRAGSWLAGRSLQDLDLSKEGVLVLGVHRSDGRWSGTPSGETELKPNDSVVVYGHRRRLDDLVRRPCGMAGQSQRDQAMRAYEDHRDGERGRR